jgi:uncharacterized membrane protein YdbT with pleckstrin-like domain
MTITTQDLQGATHEERQDMARAAVEAAPEAEQIDVVQAAVDALSPEQRQDVLKDAVQAAPAGEQKEVAQVAVDALSPEQRQDVIKDAVQAAPAGEQKEVAKAAVDALSPEQRQELITSNWPQASTDRLYVYVAGFSAAVVVVLGLALVAWGAGGSSSLATSLVVLATGFSSAILGGLLGAYVQR